MSTFTSWEDELKHFGIKGMRWGVRRFQDEDGSLTTLGRRRYGYGDINRSAHGVKRDLNRLDRDYTVARVRSENYANRAAKRDAKLQKKMKKKGISEYQKDEKTKKLEERAEKYKKLMSRAEKMTNKIINKALKAGYSVNSRDTIRFVKTGKTYAFNTLMTGLGLATSLSSISPIAVDGYSLGNRAIGKHYKVKNNGLSLRTHKSGLSNYRLRDNVSPLYFSAKNNPRYQKDEN